MTLFDRDFGVPAGLYELLPMGLDPSVAACVLHKGHVPSLHVIQLHHVVPQAWTHFLGLPDSVRIPVCGTGHDTIHLAIRQVIKAGKASFLLGGATANAVRTAVAFWAAHSELAADPHLLQMHDLRGAA